VDGSDDAGDLDDDLEDDLDLTAELADRSPWWGWPRPEPHPPEVRAPASARRDAEVLVARPGWWPPREPVRSALLELKAEAEAALTVADEALRAAAAERCRCVERLEACNVALSGTGKVVDGEGRTVQRFQHRVAIPLHDPFPADDALVPIRGGLLREAAVEVLRAGGRPSTVAEVRRLLAAHGVRPSGRASQTLSNALRAEVLAGRVVRTARNRYEAA
jgi:hypothetical protein